jgi:O-antigen/teichoic acid export membrane protein
VLSLGALSGGLSGFFAVMFIFSFQSDLLGYALLAMCLGAAGSLLATMLFLRSASEIVRTRYTPPAVWADLDTVQAPSGEFKF